MFQKLKDGVNKVKAKIGGDDLDEKLVSVVSEENWQASTHQLHEIANAAYNYEKWQRINDFIWQKLKKSKSWKKILKTFNMIQFLLKNGPPSIISNLKYDLYQLRVFESYSNYVDGVDKGQPIREKAKVVVTLLNNEEQLEEERVKAKTIREKMSNVVGGSSYGGSYGGSSGYGGGNSGYGGGAYGSSKYENDSKKKTESTNNYNYGNTVGHFGDYSYNKSTIDKYKDTKNDKPNVNMNLDGGKKEEKKPQIIVETKKPFEKIATKLSKPGEKKETPIIDSPKKTPTTETQQTAPNNNIIDFDFMGSEPAKAQQSFSFEQPAVAPPVQPPSQPQTQPIFHQQPTQPVQQIPTQQPVYQQPQQPPTQPPFNPYGQVPAGYGQPQYPPNQYGQFGGYNQFGHPQPQQGYMQQPPPPYGVGVGGQGFPQQGYSPYVNPMYPTTAPLAVNQMNQVQQKGNLNAGMGITLSTGKKEEEFGNFASSNPGTAQNVNWLSNTEKGLIDFSDFGTEIKKDPKPASKNQISNNIQIDTWSW